MLEMAFACLAGTGAQARHALLLAQSLRAFGGQLAESPMMALVPVGGVVDAALEAEWARARISAVPYALPAGLEAVPLAERAAGAAQAETAAGDLAQQLVWLDSDSLILREPASLRLPPQARIGCRPVDLRLVGSPWEEAAGPFWEAIYAGCGVQHDDVFPVRTSVEGQQIRAYFNAGCLAARPEARLLRRWLASILTLAAREAFRGLGGREALFFHQAVLAGMLLARLNREEIFDLPPTVNYPLHLHERVPHERRPRTLGDVETCRYESVFEHDDWAKRLPVDDDLRAWLEARRWMARNE